MEYIRHDIAGRASQAEPRRFLYLTAKGVESARRIYQKYKSENVSAFNAELKTHLLRLTAEKWDSFDDIYAGLYALNLKSPPDWDASFIELAGLEKQASLNVLTDTQFPTVTSETSFENSLPSEVDVADVALLTRALRSVVQLPMVPTTVSLGCVYLGYSIYTAPRNRSVSVRDWLGMDRSTIESHAFWSDWKQRFNISEIEFIPVE